MGAALDWTGSDDAFGNTPLHWGCWHGKLSCLQLLLNAGANPSTVNAKGEQPLDTARARREYRRKKFQRASRGGAEARQKSGYDTAEDPDALYEGIETLFRKFLPATAPQLHRGDPVAEEDEKDAAFPPGFQHGQAIPLAGCDDPAGDWGGGLQEMSEPGGAEEGGQAEADHGRTVAQSLAIDSLLETKRKALKRESSQLEAEDFFIIEHHVTALEAHRVLKVAKREGEEDEESGAESSAWVEGVAKLRESLEKSRADAAHGPSQAQRDQWAATYHIPPRAQHPVRIEFLGHSVQEDLPPPDAIELAAAATLTIGRSRQSGLHLRHLSVSNEHATLRRKNEGTVTVEDQGSKHGTFVNGAQIQPRTAVVVMPGDTLGIASFLFIISQDLSEEEEEEEPQQQVDVRPALTKNEAAREAQRRLRKELLGKGDAFEAPERAVKRDSRDRARERRELQTATGAAPEVAPQNSRPVGHDV